MDFTKRDLLIEIAKMYYIEGKTQQKIADYFNISRSNVSKYLQISKDEKIVEIRINDTSSIGIKYQNFLKNNFNLKEVVVVKSEKDIITTKDKIGIAAAKILQSLIRPKIKIGLTIGTTVYSTVKKLQASNEQLDIEIVQMLGGAGRLDLNIEGVDIAMELAKKLNAVCNLLQAPAIVNNAHLKQMLVKEHEISRVLKMAEEVDTALFGVGQLSYEETSYYKGGHLSHEEFLELLRQGATAMLCGILIKEDGTILDNEINHRVIGFELNKIKNIPNCICVAAGIKKVKPVLSALNGNFIDYLVIDEDIASQIYTQIKNS